MAAIIADMMSPPEQIAAIKALMAGGTPTAAVRSAGVHRATRYRWIEDDEVFKSALAECGEAGRSSINDQFLAIADDWADENVRLFLILKVSRYVGTCHPECSCAVRRILKPKATQISRAPPKLKSALRFLGRRCAWHTPCTRIVMGVFDNALPEITSVKANVGPIMPSTHK